jgi:amino acid permease
MVGPLRQFVMLLVVVICIIGFIYDVLVWLRAGSRSAGDVLFQYWWALLYMACYVIDAILRRVKSPKS